MSAFWTTLLTILITLEAPVNQKAADRAYRREKAVGVLQIRPAYLADVNNNCRNAVMTKYGRPLTLSDMNDPDKARWTAQQYLMFYGSRYTKKTGKTPTPEVYARMHNGGGGAGWTNSLTDPYWTKFQKECTKRGINSQTLKD